jgi:DNA-binding NarL/FixJ family response regulator
MLTSDTAASSQAAARAHGAAGYLFKGSDPDLVLDAIRQVAAGGTAWPEDLGPDASLPTPVCRRTLR